MSQRKFIQPVAMIATIYQVNSDLLPPLREMGYSIENFDPSKYPCSDLVLTDFGSCWGNFGNTNYFKDPKTYSSDHDRCFVDHYNPELFLALAAMSDGSGYRGELVTVRKGGSVGKIIDAGEGGYIIEFADGSRGAFLGSDLNKLTAEEIIAHFSKESELQAKADAFADSAKLSKAIDEWAPKPFEAIWVWNNYDTMRRKMLFAFCTKETVFALEEEYKTWSNFEVHEFQNFAKIDDPVEITETEIKQYFSSLLGVPAEILKIVQ